MSVTAGPLLDKIREMEYLLRTRFDATGEDLDACLDSIPGVLPSPLVAQIRYVETIRDRLLHERRYSYSGDANDFWWLCNAIISELANFDPSAPAPAPPEESCGPDEGMEGERLAAAVPVEDQPAEAVHARPARTQSALAGVAAFLAALPARAQLRLARHERGWVETAVVAVALLATALLLLVTFASLRSGQARDIVPTPAGKGVTLPVATVTREAPRPTPTPTQPPTATPTTAPVAGEACRVEWQEYSGDALAGKNRNQVWNGVVKQQVEGSGLTPAKFYGLVAEQNPALAADGYVFKKGKTYLLPRCE